MASGPDVAVAEYHIFLGSQAFQANRATGVDLVGGNADFSPQAIFETVRKAGGGVDHHRTGIHLGQEPAGPGVVLGDDAVGMLGAVTVDVLDCAIQAVDHTHRKNRRQVLFVPVVLGGGTDAFNNREGTFDRKSTRLNSSHVRVSD